MTIHLYTNDLPKDLKLGPVVAIDTEAMGLHPHRDRLCLVQLSSGDGVAHLVQFTHEGYPQAHNLRKLLEDSKVKKIFHFARFDVGILQHCLNVPVNNIFCTKIASKLSRTYADKHGLKDLCKELLNIDLTKHERTSDWGREILSPEQLTYAASDVLHLHTLMNIFIQLLEREDKTHIAQACFDFLPTRARLDLLVGNDYDIFMH